jgi:hypothetical protein
MKIITLHHGDYVDGGGAQFMSLSETERTIALIPKMDEHLFTRDASKVTLIISGPVPRCMNKARMVGGLLEADGHVVVEALESGRHEYFPKSSKETVHQYIGFAVEAAAASFASTVYIARKKEEGKPLPDGINVIMVNHDTQARMFNEHGVLLIR